MNKVELVVLILVLMEYGLWLLHAVLMPRSGFVLILVLMEYGLWHIIKAIKRPFNGS